MKKSHRIVAAVLNLIGFIAGMWLALNAQNTETAVWAWTIVITTIIVIFMLASSLNENLIENRLEKIMSMEAPNAEPIKPAETSHEKEDNNFPDHEEEYAIVTKRVRTIAPAKKTKVIQETFRVRTKHPHKKKIA